MSDTQGITESMVSANLETFLQVPKGDPSEAWRAHGKRVSGEGGEEVRWREA